MDSLYLSLLSSTLVSLLISSHTPPLLSSSSLLALLLSPPSLLLLLLLLSSCLLFVCWSRTANALGRTQQTQCKNDFNLIWDLYYIHCRLLNAKTTFQFDLGLTTIYASRCKNDFSIRLIFLFDFGQTIFKKLTFITALLTALKLTLLRTSLL